MKAALNGGLRRPERRGRSSMYDKLEHTILPLFHQHRDGYTDVMRHAIALNGSFFNSHRVMEAYALKAYALDRENDV